MKKEVDLKRKPTEEEKCLIEKYADAVLKPSQIARIVGISTQLLLQNEKFFSIYEKQVANAIYKKTRSIFEIIDANNSTHTISAIFKLLEMWNINFGTAGRTIELKGTYQQRLDQLDDALSEHELTINEYKELYLTQSERFKNIDAMQNFEKLQTLVEKTILKNQKLEIELALTKKRLKK